MKRQLGVLILLFFVAIAFSGIAVADHDDKCDHKCKCDDDDKDKCKCDDSDNKCDDDHHGHRHWWHPPWW